MKKLACLLVALASWFALGCGDDAASRDSRTSKARVALATGSIDLSVAASGPTDVKNGQSVTYTASVTNHASETVASAVLVKFSANGWAASNVTGGSCSFGSGTDSSGSCNVGALSAGGTKTLTFSGRTTKEGTTTFTATASSELSEATPDDNTASVTTDVAAGADLVLTKTGPEQAVHGDVFSYALKVRNAGPGEAAGATLVDVMPTAQQHLVVRGVTTTVGSCEVSDEKVPIPPTSGYDIYDKVTCDLGALAPSAEATVEVEVEYLQQGWPGTATNRATVASADSDTNPYNNAGTVTTLFGPVDLEAFLVGPATALTGENFTYKATITNHGPDRAGAASLDLTVTGGSIVSATPSSGKCTGFSSNSLDCGSFALASGASATVDLVLGRGTVGGVTVQARAGLNTTEPELDSSNDSKSAHVSVTLNPNQPSVDLLAAVTGPSDAKNGQGVTYTLSLSNQSGTATATGVGFKFDINGWFASNISGASCSYGGSSSGTKGTCNVGALGPAQTKTVTFTGTASQEGTSTFTATVSSEILEANPDDNTATMSTVVHPGADLVLTKTAPAEVLRGQTFDYELSLRNAGSGEASGVTLVDILPMADHDLPALEVTTSTGTCSVSDEKIYGIGGFSFTIRDKVSCELGNFAPGATANIRIRTKLSQYANPGTITNEATATSLDGDTNRYNNRATAKCLFAPVDLVAAISGPTSALTTDTLIYDASVTNDGPDRAGVASLNLNVSGGSVVSATPSAGKCSAYSTSSLSCGSAALATGESITVRLVVARGTPGVVSVEARTSLLTTEPETDTTNNTKTLTTSVRYPTPTVSLSGATASDEGTTQTYSFTASAPGGSFSVTTTSCGSAGNLVAGSLQSSSSGGSFACKFPDGGAVSKVTVVVKDGTYGTTASASVQVNVNNVDPLVSLEPAASMLDEGSVFSASGSFTDPGTDSWSGSVDYGDGASESLQIAGMSFNLAHTYADNGLYTVSASVSDDDGGTDTASDAVTVVNVPPLVDAGPDAVVTSGESYTLGGHFSDPGVLDAPWTYVVDWDAGADTDGAAMDQSATIAPSRRFCVPRDYGLVLYVTDKDGETGSDELTLTVERLIVALDIMPGTSTQPVNLKKGGVLVVALVGSASLNVTSVDPATLTLGDEAGPSDTFVSKKANGSYAVAVEDVNGDGVADLVAKFDIMALVANGDLAAATSQLVLQGVLRDGCTYFRGVDGVRVIER